MPGRGQFPTRDNCDPNDPEEFALWAFAALPGVRGAPLLMPPDYYRMVSKRLWDLGFRQVEPPTLEWVAPSATEAHWMTSPGRWVPAGTAATITEDEQARHIVDRMSMQQRAELKQALQCWRDGDPLPDTPAGNAANGLTDHQRDVVWRVLTCRN
jgi:hypothetical protein